MGTIEIETISISLFNRAGTSECTDCDRGKFQPALGAANPNKCQDCPAGWNAASEGMSSCTQCQEGRYSDETSKVSKCS